MGNELNESSRLFFNCLCLLSFQRLSHRYLPRLRCRMDLYGKSQERRDWLPNGFGNINQSLNLPPNSSVTNKATGLINGNSGTVISNTANVSVPAGVSDPNTADKATDKDTIQ